MNNKYTKKMTLTLVIILFTSVIIPLQAQQQNGLNFDGVDDFASVVGASSTIVGGTGISMSCWVYPTNTSSGWPNFDGICGFRNESSADFYLLQLNSTTLEARFRNSSSTDYTLSYSGLQLNTWQHYVLTYNGTTLALYKDNVLVQSSSASGSISSSAENFYIGKLPFQTSNFQYQGTLDEVCLWNKALTTAEISALYTCGSQLAASNLKLHFKFNQGNAGASNTGLITATNSAGTLNATLQNLALSGSTSNWVTGKPIGNFNYMSGTVCEGDSLIFSGQYISTAGNYYDTIPVPGSCDSIVVYTLNVNLAFLDTTNTSICEGDTVLFHGTPYYQTGQFDVPYAGAQCDSIYTLNLTVNPLPSLFSITGSLNVIEQQTESYSVPANSNLTYTWVIMGGAITNQPTNNAVEVLWGTPGNGAVKVIAENQNNCFSDTVTLSLIIGIDGIENRTESPISIYPNPVSNVLIIESDAVFVGKLYDSNAKLIVGFSSNRVDVSKFGKGIYMVILEFENGSTLSKQIIIE